MHFATTASNNNNNKFKGVGWMLENLFILEKFVRLLF